MYVELAKIYLFSFYMLLTGLADLTKICVLVWYETLKLYMMYMYEALIIRGVNDCFHLFILWFLHF